MAISYLKTAIVGSVNKIAQMAKLAASASPFLLFLSARAVNTKLHNLVPRAYLAACVANKPNTAVKRLRVREILSELSFQLVQRLRKSISLSAFIKL